MPDTARLESASTRTMLRFALRGDPEAERRFYLRLKERLTVLAGRHPLMPRLRSTTTPEDVASEVLVRCFAARAFQRFEDRGRNSIPRFLHVVLQRTLVDMLRRSKSAKRRSSTGADPVPVAVGELDAYEPPSNDPTPTSQARSAELAELCQKLLGGRELEVWKLIEFEGLQPADVAERLDIAPSTVRSLFHRARCKLIRAFDEREYAGD